jgi:hypothetical protein
MPEKIKLHYKDGTTAELDAVDARRALRDHPSEWSSEPFPADVRKAEAEKTAQAAAEEEARRAAAARKAQEEAAAKAREEQAKADAEAMTIAAQQEEKRKADEAARNGQFGHIPSETAFVFIAKHRGAGSYSVLDENGNELLEKMSKEDADAFNAMTDADKAEYVKAAAEKKD